MLVDHDEAYQNRVYLYAVNRCACVCVCMFFTYSGCMHRYETRCEHINMRCDVAIMRCARYAVCSVIPGVPKTRREVLNEGGI